MRKVLFLSVLSCAAMFFLNSCCGEGRINGTKIQEGNNLVGLITDTETGKGIAGVAVSDGYTFTTTDKNGVYQFVGNPLTRVV